MGRDLEEKLEEASSKRSAIVKTFPYQNVSRDISSHRRSLKPITDIAVRIPLLASTKSVRLGQHYLYDNPGQSIIFVGLGDAASA